MRTDQYQKEDMHRAKMRKTSRKTKKKSDRGKARNPKGRISVEKTAKKRVARSGTARQDIVRPSVKEPQDSSAFSKRQSSAASNRNPRASHQEYERKLTVDRSARTLSQGTRKAKAKSEDRERRQRVSRRGSYIKIALVVTVFIALLVGVYFLYHSSFLSVKSIEVKGNSQLTSSYVVQTGKIPNETTMLRAPLKNIEKSIALNPWIASVKVSRSWPSTLVITITERTPVGLVTSADIKDGWLVSQDSYWLEPSSQKAAQSTESTQTAPIAIKGPTGLMPKAGAKIDNAAIKNSIDIIEGSSDEFKAQIKRIKTESVEKTEIVLDDGVLVYFGPAEQIEEKEKIIEAMLKEHAGGIVYINVRVPEKPTWRGKE